MNELLEIIEDLETLEVLHDGGSKDAHIEYLLKKYRERFKKAEADMERQYELFQDQLA